MQKKLFSIIFGVIFALVFFINAFLILSEEEFFIGQDFSWFLSCVLAEFFLVFLCSFFLARFLSYIFLKPLEKIDFENLEHIPYPELKKMLEKIKLENKAFKIQFKHLKRKKQELQSLTQNMNDGLIFISRTGEILSENLSAEKYFANLNLIHNILELKNSQFLELVLKYLKEFKKGKLKSEIRENFTFHYPNNLECELVFSPIFSQKKKFKGMLIVLCDITELKRLQNLRKEFSANVTHELKTPLTSIMASSEMIKNKLVAPQDLPNFVDKIHLESKRLLDMINEILKISFLDETQTLPFHRVNLKEVVERAYKRLELLANQHTIRFELDLEDAYILGIDELLENLVFNLCDNGIKYNHKGGFVKVRLKKLSNFVELSIKDNGIGIPKEFQERVFERFFCVDKSRSKKIGGSGLGLSIVKSVLKLHKASIELKSELGKGSEFKMRFMQNLQKD
ncbi:PAS domain S-box protein [Campylobacter upsaliensis]|uniref:PAS domain-containing sensor histidine kinase n=1 Tax=Campylobacter upsaliensis TaxID=28080 RepID=UPI00126AC764|nr:ATP-binding protein [Campylobacter upsaliensis]EAK1046780.1 PAS domain S-box protein [Campylobacter upsaliensis]EAK9970968.1 PAS domain S-box protein [Campylobacter upsaliensis]EFS9251735.1 PAS domain S-box protein [Campylobacter upsaliensis]EGY3994259.1 PAS domain S-box protein [Campylobacter upsaliensis]QKF87679.1 two-component system sensor histidine kinase [Campylobacter upsaliensis RM3940]